MVNFAVFGFNGAIICNSTMDVNHKSELSSRVVYNDSGL